LKIILPSGDPVDHALVKENLLKQLAAAIVTKKPHAFGVEEGREVLRKCVISHVVSEGKDLSQSELETKFKLTDAQREEVEDLVDIFEPLMRGMVSVPYSYMAADEVCSAVARHFDTIWRSLTLNDAVIGESAILSLKSFTNRVQAWKDRLEISYEPNDARLLSVNIDTFLAQIKRTVRVGVLDTIWSEIEALSALSCYFEAVGKGVVELKSAAPDKRMAR
jgi:hypothetical protein